MNVRSENSTCRFINLSALFFLLIGFSQCINREDELLKKGDASQELLEELNNIPRVEDKAPPIQEPDYEGLFTQHLSLEKLEEIGDSIAEGGLSSASLEILDGLMSDIDPEIMALLGNVNPQFLLEMMDPENDLDPELQELLQKMLALADLHLPQIKAIEGLIDLETLKERITREKTAAGSESFRTGRSNSECAAAVYAQFGSGARECSFREQEEFEKIDVSYHLRMDDAEQRYLQRNLLIKTLYKNRLVIKAALMADIAQAVHSLDDQAQQEKVKMQIKYVGLLYSTYIRMHLNAIYEGGLSINHLYFQKEVQMITDQRLKMEEEITANLRKCLEQVNSAIIEETNERCPGEEPFLY